MSNRAILLIIIAVFTVAGIAFLLKRPEEAPPELSETDKKMGEVMGKAFLNSKKQLDQIAAENYERYKKAEAAKKQQAAGK